MAKVAAKSAKKKSTATAKNPAKGANAKGANPGPYVIVRTFSAGVHIGHFVSLTGKECVLANARRIWSWKGANTLHEISLRGVGTGSRISEPVASVTLTEAIEVIQCTPAAQTNLEAGKWA